MDMSIIDSFIVPIIVVASLCIGYILKHWLPTDDKWIPTVLFIFGAVSGAIVNGFSYEGIVMGMVSGLAAVGLHQAFKQHLKLPMGDDEYYAMGHGDISEEDVVEEEEENVD